MKLKVKGINCEACTHVIQLELDKAGFNTVRIDYETTTVKIPNKLKERLEEIEKAISKAGAYSLEN